MSDNYQLGFKDTEVITEPRALLARTNVDLSRFNFILAGSYHTLAYKKSTRKLVVWGENRNGQLGLGHYNSI
jgi:alpha-tubulin suppressor-like RCC1 family protein